MLPLCIGSSLLPISPERVCVNIAPPIVTVHRHPSEEGSKEVIELLVLEILSSRVTLPLVLGAGTILLRSKSVVVCFFLGIDEHGVSVGDFLEDFLRAFVLIFVGVEAKCQHAIGLLDFSFGG